MNVPSFVFLVLVFASVSCDNKLRFKVQTINDGFTSPDVHVVYGAIQPKGKIVHYTSPRALTIADGVKGKTGMDVVVNNNLALNINMIVSYCGLEFFEDKKEICE